MLGWEFAPGLLLCGHRALQACGSGEQSCRMAREYLIHVEILHWSFKIPFPSFKPARGFLQLIHGHCQMNLRN